MSMLDLSQYSFDVFCILAQDCGGLDRVTRGSRAARALTSTSALARAGNNVTLTRSQDFRNFGPSDNLKWQSVTPVSQHVREREKLPTARDNVPLGEDESANHNMHEPSILGREKTETATMASVMETAPRRLSGLSQETNEVCPAI